MAESKDKMENDYKINFKCQFCGYGDFYEDEDLFICEGCDKIVGGYCPECYGTGKVEAFNDDYIEAEETCPECGGLGIVWEKAE